MSENEKKGLQAMAVFMVAALLALLTFLSYEEAHRVRFADRRVGNAITMSSGTGKKTEDFRVEDFAKVEELFLGTPSYYETLSDIERCVNLKRLEIGVRGGRDWIPEEEDILGEEGIARLERELADILESCGQLEYLYIYNGNGTCRLSSLEFLEKGKKLKYLLLYQMGKLDYSSVSSCSSIWSLMLIGCSVTESDLREIGRMENLHALCLAGAPITELGSIAELENLEMLFLDGTAIAELGNIVELENLELLWLNDTAIAGVEGIGKLENLQELNLSETAITELGSIVELENLEQLYLSNTSIAGVEGIGKLENLHMLELSDTAVTELGDIVELENLEHLYLSNTSIAGVEGIGKLENLKTLFLYGTEITEAGELVNLKNLQTLNIADTPLVGNKEELKLLREALPDTKIVTYGTGW